MRSALLLALAFIAPMAFAAGAVAQPEGSIGLTVDPAAVKARPGDVVNLTLLVTNHLERPVTLLLEVAGPHASGRVEHGTITLEPRERAQVAGAAIVSHDAPAGETRVRVSAIEADAPMASAARAETALVITVVRDGSMLKPHLEPEGVNVTTRFEREERVEFVVTNPTREFREYEARLELPQVWRGSVEPRLLRLAAGESTTVTVTLRAPDAWHAGMGALHVGEPGAVSTSHLALYAEGPEDDHPPQLVQLGAFVDPQVLTVDVGGSVQGDLHVTNTGQEDATFTLTLPSVVGFSGNVEPGPHTLSPGETGTFGLMVSPDVAAASGRHDMTIHILKDGFELRVGFEVVLDDPAAMAVEAASGLDEHLDGAVTSALVIAGTGAAVGGIALAHRRWPLAASLLYTRLLPSRMLDHPVRGRLHALIKQRPGITYGELQRELGLASGVLTHHLRMLEKARHVFSSPDGQQRRYFDVTGGRVDSVPPLDQRTLAMLHEDGAMTAAELARRLGVSRQALHYHVKRLARDGRIEMKEEGRATMLACKAPTLHPET